MLLIQLYYNIKRKIRKNNLNLSYEKVRIIINFFYKIYFKYLFCIVLKNSYIYLIIKDNNFKNLFIFLKNSFFFSCSQLLDLIIVDRLEMKLKSGKRFNYVYVLLSVINNIRVFVSGFIGLFEILPSLTSLFKSIDWLEREAWDMFGIFFCEHFNLRRILTDYGFKGHPLRKDFPLSGYIEIRYDEISKSIVLEPLELMQEFRFFKLEIPWRR